MPSHRSHVAQTDHGIAGELTLDIQVVVHGIRSSQVRVDYVDDHRLEESEVHRASRSWRSERKFIGNTPRSGNINKWTGEGWCTENVSHSGRSHTERRCPKILKRAFLLAAVEVNTESAADGELAGSMAGNRTQVGRPGKSKTRTKVPIPRAGSRILATRISGEVQVLRCSGENRGLLAGNDAVECLPAKLIVVVRRINLISRPECQCQVVLHLPLVLRVAGILEEIVRNSQQEVRAGFTRGEWSRPGEIKVTVVLEKERVIHLEAADVKAELQAVLPYNLGEVVSKLIVLVHSGLGTVVAETQIE